ncbi:class I SAM-dependent methyltransferase [Candidatus Microgenomates bacterium]|nr:MAG: class I SAM-dependent methyltransferase [Candidatus Microgenomates bacterium]
MVYSGEFTQKAIEATREWTERPLIQRRVLPLYRLGKQELKISPNGDGPINCIVDEGTFNGFGVSEMFTSGDQYIRNMISIDVDPDILQVAAARKDLQTEMHNGRLLLAQMDARNLALPYNYADLITCIEVIGVAQGTDSEQFSLDDVNAVLSQARQVLKGDGAFIMTFRDEAVASAIHNVDWSFEIEKLKGLALNKKVITELIDEYFFEAHLWGQILMRDNGEMPGIYVPTNDDSGSLQFLWKEEAFAPVPEPVINTLASVGQVYYPHYWAVVAKHPRK